MSLNLSDITQVSMAVGRKRKVYDIRYLGEGKGFQFGDVVKASIIPFAFNVGHANGNVYIQCVEDGNGQVFNTKYTGDGEDRKARGKTGTFNRPNLRQLLDVNGSEDVDYFRLEKVEVKGATLPIYKFVGITEAEATVIETEEDTASSNGVEDSVEDADDDFDLEEDDVDDEGEDVFAKL